MATPGSLELVYSLSLYTATKSCAGLGSGSGLAFRCLTPQGTGGPCSHSQTWSQFFHKKTQKIMVDCQLIYTENSKINKKYMLTGENIHMFPLRGVLLFT